MSKSKRLQQARTRFTRAVNASIEASMFLRKQRQKILQRSFTTTYDLTKLRKLP